MQLNVPSNLESLINKRLSSSAYSNAEDVLHSTFGDRILEHHEWGATSTLIQSKFADHAGSLPVKE